MSKTTNKFSPEVRERAVRLVFETDPTLQRKQSDEWRSYKAGSGLAGAEHGHRDPKAATSLHSSHRSRSYR